MSASSIPDHQASPLAIVLDAPPDALAGYMNPSAQRIGCRGRREETFRGYGAKLKDMNHLALLGNLQPSDASGTKSDV